MGGGEVGWKRGWTSADLAFLRIGTRYLQFPNQLYKPEQSVNGNGGRCAARYCCLRGSIAGGVSKATSRSSRPWAGPSTRCDGTRRCAAIGCWCGVPSRSVGGIWVTARWMHPQGWMTWWHHRARMRSPATQLGGKKNQEVVGNQRPSVCWPGALRKVRAWLEPWIMLGRYWRAWSPVPPTKELQALLSWVQQGFPLYLYEPL